MAKKKTSYSNLAPRAPSPAPRATPGASRAHSWFSAGSIRETIESFAVAFILAFLFRTLRGRGLRDSHRLDGADADGAAQGSALPRVRLSLSGRRQQRSRGNGRSSAAGSAAVRTSSRSLVRCAATRPTSIPAPPPGASIRPMAAIEFWSASSPTNSASPQRWDVFVFKYPGEAQTNYIKRLVGLPNETVRLWHGDLYIKADGRRRVSHRTPAAREAAGHGPDRVRQRLRGRRDDAEGLAAALAALARGRADGPRRLDERRRQPLVCRSTARPATPQWLRYRHFVPSIDDWALLAKTARCPKTISRGRD